MYDVWAKQNKVDPCFKEFAHLYWCNEHGVGHKGWYYFMFKSKGKMVVLDFPGSCKGWKISISLLVGIGVRVWS